MITINFDGWCLRIYAAFFEEEEEDKNIDMKRKRSLFWPWNMNSILGGKPHSKMWPFNFCVKLGVLTMGEKWCGDSIKRRGVFCLVSAAGPWACPFLHQLFFLIQNSKQLVNNYFGSFQVQIVSTSIGHLLSSCPHLFPSLITSVITFIKKKKGCRFQPISQIPL